VRPPGRYLEATVRPPHRQRGRARIDKQRLADVVDGGYHNGIDAESSGSDGLMAGTLDDVTVGATAGSEMNQALNYRTNDSSTNTVAVTGSTFQHWGDDSESGVVFSAGSQSAKANITWQGNTISDPLPVAVTGLVAFVSDDGVAFVPPSICLDPRDSVALEKGVTVSNPGVLHPQGVTSCPQP
jgi:hypothetical protein